MSARSRARVRVAPAQPTLHLPALSSIGLAVACLCASLFSGPAAAQGVATEAQLETVTITGGVRSGLAREVPSNSASKSAEDLRDQNLFNPEDALKYVPNTSIRKRYIGDRNAMIGGRSFGTLQPSRGLAYVDGYLISNFLGRFDGPRWNMVTPEAIARVDVLYGPFSAIYPGNSIGTTVAVTEREPKQFEASARVTGYRQSFDQYGHSDSYNGHQASVFLGTRLESGLWFTLGVNHQDSTSQPMNYANATANATTGRFATVTPPTGTTAVPVTGIVYDRDPKGLNRAVFGANSGAIDHTQQDTVKVKAGYAFTPELLLQGMAGWWTNHTENSNVSFLKDANGNTVWSGYVTDGRNTFNILPTTFAPSTRDEAHLHTGLTLKTKRRTGWNGSVVYSNYRILEDVARQASQPDPVAANGGSGTATYRDGTGWNTFEVQAAYTPVAGDWGDGRHSLTLGAHRNAYVLDSPTYTVSDWRHESSATAKNQSYQGRTEVQALYAQDAWRINDTVTLTAGLRTERFRAYDGEQFGGGRTVTYEERKLSGTSPKASLAWRAQDDLTFKISAGRGVRFPNVEELYNGTVTATSTSLSDPDLAPERSSALELSAEKEWDRQRLRVSLFHDDVRDAILRQSDTTVTPSVTRISNVDRVKTQGIEFVWQTQDWLLTGLSLDANLALADSKVTENTRDPLMVGKHWLRVPKVRANLLAAYRPTAEWMGSLGVRHSGRAYNDAYNLDVNPNVYGGVSSFTFVDLRTSYKISPKLEVALGVDNVADSRGYQAHPYPGRTLFTELRAQY